MFIDGKEYVKRYYKKIWGSGDVWVYDRDGDLCIAELETGDKKINEEFANLIIERMHEKNKKRAKIRLKEWLGL